MIFHKALLREIAGAALATFVVLVGITLTTQIVRLMGQAAGGAITLDSIVLLLGLSAIGNLPALLSLTLFISVLMTLSRSYRDSEMVVWFSGGLGLTRWIRPVLTFALPMVFVIALLALGLSPWAVGKSEELRRIMDSRDDASAVSPGVFRESRQAERVYFVEEISGAQNEVANIFVSSTQQGKQGVMIASRGFQETAANGDRFLVMLNGRRYEGQPGNADFRIYEFERYAVRIESREVERPPSTKTTATVDLVQQPAPRNLGELSWRIGLPLSALILALLAIPLSFANPRAGRSMSIVLALLAYMIYSNMLSIVQASIAQSRIGLVPGVLAVHAVMLVLLLLLFYRRLSTVSLLRMFR